MKETKAINVSKKDLRDTILFKEHHRFSSNIFKGKQRLTNDVGIQSNSRTFNGSMYKDSYRMRKHYETFRNYPAPKKIYLHHKSRSHTEIGVGSVKPLQKKKVKRIYLPQTDDRGVGSDHVYNSKQKYTRPSGGTDAKKTLSKCVGGTLAMPEGFVCAKVSPIVQMKSGTTSPHQPITSCRCSPQLSIERRDMNAGSHCLEVSSMATNTQTDYQESENLKSSKDSDERTAQFSKTSKESDSKFTKDSKQDDKDSSYLKESPKIGSKRAKDMRENKDLVIKDTSSSDSLLQSVKNLEQPSEYNKIEVEQKQVYPSIRQKFSEKTEKREIDKTDVKKSTSLFKKRFTALRKSIAKKESTPIDSDDEEEDRTPSLRDVSISSDPPSLEERSFIGPRKASRKKTRPVHKLSAYKKQPYGTKTSNTWSKAKVIDSEYNNGVKGMFKLWGRKFNFDEGNFKKDSFEDRPQEKGEGNVKESVEEIEEPSSAEKVPVKGSKKEGKKFFFFKRKIKEKERKPQPCTSFNNKKAPPVTTGHCEIKKGFNIKIGAKSPLTTARIKSQRFSNSNYEELPRTAWLMEYLTGQIESRKSVNIRWSNRTYATSSSTLFELMGDVYKGSGISNIMLRSQSVSSTDESSDYSQYRNPKTSDYRQTVKAYMVPTIVTDLAIKLPSNLVVTSKTRKNDEKAIEDWYVEASKGFANNIELALHPSSPLKRNDIEGSIRLKKDSPKDLTSQVHEENPQVSRSYEGVLFKITNYESKSQLLSKDSHDKHNDGDAIDTSPEKLEVAMSFEENGDERKTDETVVREPTGDAITQGGDVECDTIAVGLVIQGNLNEVVTPYSNAMEYIERKNSNEIFSNSCQTESSSSEASHSHSIKQDFPNLRQAEAITLFVVSDCHMQCCRRRHSVSFFPAVTVSLPNFYSIYTTFKSSEKLNLEKKGKVHKRKNENDERDETTDDDGYSAESFLVKKVKDSIYVYKDRKVHAEKKMKWFSFDESKFEKVEANHKSNRKKGFSVRMAVDQEGNISLPDEIISMIEKETNSLNFQIDFTPHIMRHKCTSLPNVLDIFPRKSHQDVEQLEYPPRKYKNRKPTALTGTASCKTILDYRPFDFSSFLKNKHDSLFALCNLPKSSTNKSHNDTCVTEELVNGKSQQPESPPTSSKNLQQEESSSHSRSMQNYKNNENRTPTSSQFHDSDNEKAISQINVVVNNDTEVIMCSSPLKLDNILTMCSSPLKLDNNLTMCSSSLKLDNNLTMCSSPLKLDNNLTMCSSPLKLDNNLTKVSSNVDRPENEIAHKCFSVNSLKKIENRDTSLLEQNNNNNDNNPYSETLLARSNECVSYLKIDVIPIGTLSNTPKEISLLNTPNEIPFFEKGDTILYAKNKDKTGIDNEQLPVNTKFSTSSKSNKEGTLCIMLPKPCKPNQFYSLPCSKCPSTMHYNKEQYGTSNKKIQKADQTKQTVSFYHPSHQIGSIFGTALSREYCFACDSCGPKYQSAKQKEQSIHMCLSSNCPEDQSRAKCPQLDAPPEITTLKAYPPIGIKIEVISRGASPMRQSRGTSPMRQTRGVSPIRKRPGSPAFSLPKSTSCDLPPKRTISTSRRSPCPCPPHIRANIPSPVPPKSCPCSVPPRVRRSPFRCMACSPIFTNSAQIKSVSTSPPRNSVVRSTGCSPSPLTKTNRKVQSDIFTYPFLESKGCSPLTFKKKGRTKGISARLPPRQTLTAACSPTRPNVIDGKIIVARGCSPINSPCKNKTLLSNFDQHMQGIIRKVASKFGIKDEDSVKCVKCLSAFYLTNAENLPEYAQLCGDCSLRGIDKDSAGCGSAIVGVNSLGPEASSPYHQEETSKHDTDSRVCYKQTQTKPVLTQNASSSPCAKNMQLQFNMRTTQIKSVMQKQRHRKLSRSSSSSSVSTKGENFWCNSKSNILPIELRKQGSASNSIGRRPIVTTKTESRGSQINFNPKCPFCGKCLLSGDRFVSPEVSSLSKTDKEQCSGKSKDFLNRDWLSDGHTSFGNKYMSYCSDNSFRNVYLHSEPQMSNQRLNVVNSTNKQTKQFQINRIGYNKYCQTENKPSVIFSKKALVEQGIRSQYHIDEYENIHYINSLHSESGPQTTCEICNANLPFPMKYPPTVIYLPIPTSKFAKLQTVGIQSSIKRTKNLKTTKKSTSCMYEPPESLVMNITKLDSQETTDVETKEAPSPTMKKHNSEKKNYNSSNAPKDTVNLINNLYKSSNLCETMMVNKISSIKKDKKHVETEKSDKVSDVLEINFKVRVRQRNKTTELNLDSKSNDTPSIKANKFNTKPDFYVMHTNKDEEEKSKDDINISIMIENSSDKKTVDKSTDYINAKEINTVSTGCSKHHLENIYPNLAFSVHRATIDLTKSSETPKIRSSIDVINSHNSYSKDSITKGTKGFTATSNSSMAFAYFTKTPPKEMSKSSETIRRVSKSPSSNRYLSGDNSFRSSDPRPVKSISFKSHASLLPEDKIVRTNDETTDIKEWSNQDIFGNVCKCIKSKSDSCKCSIDSETSANRVFVTAQKRSSGLEKTDVNLNVETTNNLSKEILINAPKSKREQKKNMLKQMFENPKCLNDKQIVKSMLKEIMTSDSDISTSKAGSIKQELVKDITCWKAFTDDPDSLNNLDPSQQSRSTNSAQSCGKCCTADDSNVQNGCQCSTNVQNKCLCSTFAYLGNTTGGCCCTSNNENDKPITCDVTTEYSLSDIRDVATSEEGVHSRKSSNKSSMSNTKPATKDIKIGNDSLIKISDVYDKKDGRQYILPEPKKYKNVTKVSIKTKVSTSNDEKVISNVIKCESSSKNKRKDIFKKKKKRISYRNEGDVLQSNETKKAVLEIYAEKTGTKNGEFVANLPKFVNRTEEKLYKCFEQLENKRFFQGNFVMMYID